MVIHPVRPHALKDPREYQRPAQLAAALAVSRKTVHRWADKGVVEKTRLAPGLGVRVRLRP